MKKVLIIVVLICISSGIGGAVTDLSRELPNKIGDWKSDGQDITYDRKTLYDYMNGGAEVYLAFDFRNVFVRKYINPDGDEIILDIYDMGSSYEAFGIFSCDREDEEAEIGQDSEFGFGLLRFWKGRYFVSIMAGVEGEAVDQAVLKLGREVDSVLDQEGPTSEILMMLPGEGLEKNRVSYFHSNVNLNNRFFLASENILFLGDDTECAFAEYDSGGEEAVKLLIVRYPDDSKAAAAFASFLSGYMPEAGDAGLYEMENQKWTLARIHGPVISIVFDAEDEEAARRLQTQIKF